MGVGEPALWGNPLGETAPNAVLEKAAAGYCQGYYGGNRPQRGIRKGYYEGTRSQRGIRKGCRWLLSRL